ncbi:Alpha 1,4-glycosyltransferase family protein, putative isoform 2 [Capsicum annuum]|uniref:uncharacterized protein At4g19900 isoform X1 n=2 Tax=Capsicum annuum TaxID=4072 RepID=UPI0007BF5366|nr:uncharacterized protein At4g19900 isoform X1 [Capsicum annuum]KAF3641597.1 Alpha 1,4-glycosyltransferase family protein, putative isoform 2 [Capsicum annuum]
MLRNLRTRRRPLYGAHICALAAAILLLLSVSLLYSRLNFFLQPNNPHPHHTLQYDAVSLNDSLVDDLADADYRSSDDRIDEQDVADNSNSNDDELLLSNEEDEEEVMNQYPRVSSTYFYDQRNGVVRRAFNKRSIEEWEDYVNFESRMKLGLGFKSDESKAAFGSDDLPVDVQMRMKLSEIKSVEDALLLKGSPLREGWGEWFEKKSDFLRRDRMFKSNLEVLNPNNNPMLQDPDGPGITGLSRGDKIVLKGLMNEYKKVPFLAKKPLSVSESTKSELVNDALDLQKMVGLAKDDVFKSKELKTNDEDVNRGKRVKHRTLNDNARIGKRVVHNSDEDSATRSKEEIRNGDMKVVEGDAGGDVSRQVFADGKRWGYFPGLQPKLSFTNFMDSFFRKAKCTIRVFMVWNSPAWMFTARYQRGLESVLNHHRDACVVVFSETIELNFFSGFVKDGFKVAVVMPNLDELLLDTPTHVFASVWYEWKRTKHYPLHYSELVRLAALYKYGGIYLDSDIVVLNSLSSLNNTVAFEDDLRGKKLNGAVMAFRKHSPFIMECLKEFYASYDDSQLRWNGADLLARVASNFSVNDNLSGRKMEINFQPSFIFFPISHNNITRYFSAPAMETEKAEQDNIFKTILKEAVTFHFWNGLTSAMVPEPGSLAYRIINYNCLRCSDTL